MRYLLCMYYLYILRPLCMHLQNYWLTKSVSKSTDLLYVSNQETNHRGIQSQGYTKLNEEHLSAKMQGSEAAKATDGDYGVVNKSCNSNHFWHEIGKLCGSLLGKYKKKLIWCLVGIYLKLCRFSLRLQN